MGYKSIIFQDGDYSEYTEKRNKLLKEKEILLSKPIENRSKIKAIDFLLASLDKEEEGSENERGCATYLVPEQTTDTHPEEEITKEPKMTFKEKVLGMLGGFGVICFYLLRILIAVLPFVMIGGNFFLTLLLITINYWVPLTSVVFWVWGLVCAIQGVQDIWAILFYIIFIAIWIPFFISTIISVFQKRK